MVTRSPNRIYFDSIMVSHSSCLVRLELSSQPFELVGTRDPVGLENEKENGAHDMKAEVAMGGGRWRGTGGKEEWVGGGR